jgi:multiple sugar transport system ATP-binding protein
MAAISLDNVTKEFPDGTVAVDGISLEIADGELFVLVGPSGCGKSTLLNLVVGLEEPTRGEIRMDGEVINGLDPADRNMAMVFQSYAIYPHLSVRGNLAFPLELAKLPDDEIADRIERASRMLGIADLLDRRPRDLSGGQRQRVAMGRAIVRQPRAFLLDEPLSNLDARLRLDMRTEIARLQRRLETTMLYVTHDQTEAMTLGDRIAVLREGRVEQVGAPRELYSRPRTVFVASFIGSPAMNLLPARRSAEKIQLPLGELEIPEQDLSRSLREEHPLVAGIRPEDLRDIGSSGHRDGVLAVEATIDIVEWLGAELYVHFTVEAGGFEDVTRVGGLEVDSEGTLPVTCRLDPSSEVREGESIELVAEATSVHLFDAESGERIDRA